MVAMEWPKLAHRHFHHRVEEEKCQLPFHAQVQKVASSVLVHVARRAPQDRVEGFRKSVELVMGQEQLAEELVPVMDLVMVALVVE